MVMVDKRDFIYVYFSFLCKIMPRKQFWLPVTLKKSVVWKPFDLDLRIGSSKLRHPGKPSSSRFSPSDYEELPFLALEDVSASQAMARRGRLRSIPHR